MIITVGFLFTFLSHSSPASANLTLIPTNSNILGMPYSNHTQDWWRWFVGIEDLPGKTSHPFEDMTGEYCSTNQNGDVWFLSGSQVNTTKTCNIPLGKYIMLPILVWECSEAENNIPVQDLIDCAIENMKKSGRLILSYENVTFENDKIKNGFKVITEPMQMYLPKLNIYGSKVFGNTTAAGIGYWAMFEPPSEGEYIVKFGGMFNTVDPKSAGEMMISTSYHLKVTPQKDNGSKILG